MKALTGRSQSMHTTPVSLLERLRRPTEEEAWARFVRLYTPLLFHWARGVGLQEHDAADLVQDVFTVLLQKLPEFTYDTNKSFRAWLRTVTLNRWRNRCRRRLVPQEDASLAEVVDPADPPAFEEVEYRRHLVGRALELMRTDFQPATWKAFWECVVNGRSAAEVAVEVGLQPGAVRAAKFRVLCRLRQELAGLLD